MPNKNLTLTDFLSDRNKVETDQEVKPELTLSSFLATRKPKKAIVEKLEKPPAPEIIPEIIPEPTAPAETVPPGEVGPSARLATMTLPAFTKQREEQLKGVVPVGAGRIFPSESKPLTEALSAGMPGREAREAWKRNSVIEGAKGIRAAPISGDKAFTDVKEDWSDFRKWGKKEYDMATIELGPEEVGKLEHATGRVAVGVINILSGMVATPAIIQTGIEMLAIKTGLSLPGDMPGKVRTAKEIEKAYKSPEDRPMYKAGQLLRDVVDKAFPGNPVFAESFALSILPQGAGSLAGFYLMGGLGLKAGLPSWAAPLLAGGATESSALYMEAKIYGASDEAAMAAWVGGWLTGSTEAIPIGMAFNRINKVTGGGITKILAAGLAGTLEESLQEVVQGIGGNIVAKMTFDQKRSYFDNVAEAGGAGGILGFAANVAMTALKLRRLRLAGFKTEEEAIQLQKDLAELEKASESATLEELAEGVEIYETARRAREAGEEEASAVQIPEGKEDEIRAGITKKEKKEIAKEEKESKTEEIRKVPEARDKTEKDVIEVISKPQVERDPKKLDEKKVDDEKKAKEAEAALDEDILANKPDIDRIRDFGAGKLPDEAVDPEAVEPQAIEDPSLEAGAISDIEGAPVTEEVVGQVGPEITSYVNWKPTQAGNTVGGLEVGEDIDNLESISASLGENYEEVGIMEVPMKAIGDETKASQVHYAADDVQRSRELAEEIKESGRIDPLIIGIDEEGLPYILEGVHRYAALAELGVESFPALVVKERTSEEDVAAQPEPTMDPPLTDEARAILEKFEKAGERNAPSISPGERRRIVELGFADEAAGPRGTDTVLNDRGREVVSQIRAEQAEQAPETRKEDTPAEKLRKQVKEEEAEKVARKKEQAAEKFRKFFAVNPDGTVLSMGRKQWRKVLTKGAAGKDIGLVLEKNSREVKKLKGVPPEGSQEISAWRPRDFKAALEELDAREKELGFYKEPIPEHLEGNQRHIEVFKFYDVDTVEYEIAIDGGMGMERKPDGSLTQESKDLLLQDGKNGGPNYFDPIYDKDAKPVAISEMEELLISEMVLAPTDDLEAILNGRVRGGKKEEGGYRGYSTMEKRGEIDSEEDLAAAEKKSVEAREAEETNELRRIAEDAGIDVQLFDDASRVYVDSIDMDADQAARALLEIEGRLTEAIKAGQTEMEGPRRSIREMIAQRDQEAIGEGGEVGGYFPQKDLFDKGKVDKSEVPEQAEIPGAEEFQRESRLNDDRAKLETIRKVKPGTGRMGEAAIRDLGAREAELIKSIAEQEKTLGKERGEGQRGLFEKEAAPTEEETGGTVGGFFKREPPGPPPGTPLTQIDPDTPIAGEEETSREAYEAMKKVMVSSEDLLDSDKDKRTYPQIMRDLVTNMQTDYVSRYTPFRDMHRTLLARIGQSLPTMDLATMFEMLAGIESMARHDVTAFRIEVIDPIKKYKKEFESYIAFKRTEDRLIFAPKIKKVGDWTIDRARNGLQGLKEEVGEDTYELFVETGKKFQNHMTKMLETMVTSGLITPEDFKEIQGDSDFYAFFKVAKYFTERDLRLEGGGGITSDPKILQRITGMEDEDVQIVDLINQTMKKIWDTRIRAEKNKAKDMLYNLAPLDQDHTWLERVKRASFYSVEIKPADDFLEQLGLQTMGNGPPQTFEQQMLKVGRAIALAEEFGLTVNKKRLRTSLGRGDIGGVDKGGNITLMAFISEVMAHEMGHSFDVAQTDSDGNPITRSRKVFGVVRDVVQRLSSVINSNKTFQGELKDLVSYTRLGGSKKYQHSAKERWAEFINLYIHNPKMAKKIAPKWTMYFETELLPKEKVRVLVDKLSGLIQRVDKLPNIKTPLEAYDDKGYLELAIRKAFPSSGRHIALSKGDPVKEGFRRVLLRHEGKEVALDVDAKIYMSLEGLPARPSSIVSEFASVAAMTMKTGATVANMVFQVKNLFFRDPKRLMILSKYGTGSDRPMSKWAPDLLRFPLDWTYAFYTAMQGTYGTPNELFMQFLDAGLGYANLQNWLTPGLTGGEATQLEEEGKLKYAMSILPKLASALEMTTKLTGFKRGLRMENYEHLSKDLQAQKLMEIGAEIRRYGGSPDFWRHGLRVPKGMSLLFMFYGARMSGISLDLARLGGKNGYAKAAWMNLAVGVGLPTLYTAILNWSDDEREYYERQSEQERKSYYMIPLDSYFIDDNGFKRQNYFTIPKDDTEKLFAGIVEASVKFAYDKDPVAAREFFTGMLEDLSPINISGDTMAERIESVLSSTNPMLKLPIEMGYGRNSYYHTQIIPERMEKWDPKDQYRSTTPQVIIDIGSKIGVAPLMVEHFIRGVTAGMLTQFVRRQTQPGRDDWTSHPLWKMFASNPYGGNDKIMDLVTESMKAAGAETGERYHEVEERYQKMLDLKPSDFGRELRDIASTDPGLSKMLRNRRKRADVMWNWVDGHIRALPVGDGKAFGTRAYYFFLQMNEMGGPESKEWKRFRKEQIRKKNLTGKVGVQLEALQKKAREKK